MASNVLIINFSGLGDGLIEIPFLKNMEKFAPHLCYYHTDGTLFSEKELMKAVNLGNCLGTVPSTWRKFYEEDWLEITSFVETNRIKIIINLRNLGPLHDTGYFAFKEHGPQNVEYWNYDFDYRNHKPANIRTSMRDLLMSKCVIDLSVNPLSLREILSPYSSSSEGHVGINIHSGSKFKMWPYDKWRSLCFELLSQGKALKIFPGFTEAEICLATGLANDLKNHRPGLTTLINETNVLETLHELANTKVLISNDSWLVHAAAGLAVHTIGLYIATSPVTWGGDSERCCAVESRHLSRCENFDEGLGICRNSYVECPLIVQEGDGIEVLDVIQALEMSSAG
jgi:ADP-heptose:LPS heptosyltransferase